MQPKTPAANRATASNGSGPLGPSRWTSIPVHNLALLMAAAALSLQANYSFPERGLLSLEQASLLTPVGLLQNAYPEILRQATTRTGIFADPVLFALWAVVVVLAALRIYRERQSWRT